MKKKIYIFILFLFLSLIIVLSSIKVISYFESAYEYNQVIESGILGEREKNNLFQIILGNGQGDPGLVFDYYLGLLFLITALTILIFIIKKENKNTKYLEKKTLIVVAIFVVYYFLFDAIHNCGFFCYGWTEQPPKFFFLY